MYAKSTARLWFEVYGMIIFSASIITACTMRVMGVI